MAGYYEVAGGSYSVTVKRRGSYCEEEQEPTVKRHRGLLSLYTGCEVEQGATVTVKRRWGHEQIFLPTSRKVLPAFGTPCPVRSQIAQTIFHFDHFQVQG